MKNLLKSGLLGLTLCLISCSEKVTGSSQSESSTIQESTAVQALAQEEAPQSLLLGAENVDFKELLGEKNVALVVNQTSQINNVHLADTLLALGIKLKRAFAPEHGFRGDADAGEHVDSGKDPKTGLPIISLYGKHKKPTKEDLEGIDIVVFDIQDVGARFYTYISTMHYVMEACAEQGKEFIVLDRPNPNGDYVDGPVLDTTNWRSFVGMHPIPIVHGLTVGELAKMINGEGWLKGGSQCKLQIIPCKNYQHSDAYSLPVKPSPNLPNDLSIRLYPSLCLFEPTEVSVGRGTMEPFQIIGLPYPHDSATYEFTPKSIQGMAKYPKHEGKKCYGKDFRNAKAPQFSLDYLISYYSYSKQPSKFFTSRNFFNKLAGNDKLIKQIESGMTAEQIRETWAKDLEQYLTLRSKYLIYD